MNPTKKPVARVQSATDHQRRESIDDHLVEIDLALAVEDPPQRRREKETSRVLRILDQLGRGEG